MGKRANGFMTSVPLRMIGTLESAFLDLRAGLALRRVWWALATEDIDEQHRRTTLGPAWLLVNYGAFVGTFLVLFGRNPAVPNVATYIAIGLLVWFYMSEVVSQSVTLFLREEAFIKGTTMPLSVYILRQATESIIRSGYALAGCAVIIVLSGAVPQPMWGWALLGILILLVTTPAVIIVGAVGGAFFPDLQFIVSNIVRIGLFVTPIFWTRGSGGSIQEAFYFWNPFTHFLEIVRAPIAMEVVPNTSLVLSVAMAVILWIGALTLLGRFRKRIVFVL